LPALHAVPGQLEQVVINLVTNAAHAVENGGRILVRTRSEDEHHLMVEAEDSGPGVAPDDRERVFEPFYTTKTDAKGTGRGRSIVRNLVEPHQGRGEGGGSPLGGARFSVRLPAAR